MAEQAPKKILGRGLQALLDDIDDELPLAAQSSGVQTVPISLIAPNRDQPRKQFDETELDELSDSIRSKGMIQPILVRPAVEDQNRFEIVAGERRWRAAQRANLHDVPIIVREMDDVEALEIAIIENVQRADLNAIEEAVGYRQLIDKYGYTQEVLAKNLGKSRSHIANLMRLTNLPARVQNMVRSGELSAGHARALVTADDPEGLALRAVERGMSVRDVEVAAKDATGPRSDGPSKAAREKDADTLTLEGELSATLRMPVEISHKGKRGGELRITYRTLDDLEDICARLRGEERAVLASA